jgi:hypothetical protein
MGLQEKSMERDRYIRGRIESRFVSMSACKETREADELDGLLKKYYEYRVWRHVRSFILSSSNDRDSLRNLVQTVIRLGFSILLSRCSDEAREAGKILLTTDFDCRRIGGQPLKKTSGSGFALGQASIGDDNALGSSPAETVWTLTINVELSMAQAMKLGRCPGVVESILKALERAVPLNLDFVLRFQVSEGDYTMRLMKVDEARDEDGVMPPIMGLNTAIGKVKGE